MCFSRKFHSILLIDTKLIFLRCSLFPNKKSHRLHVTLACLNLYSYASKTYIVTAILPHDCRTHKHKKPVKMKVAENCIFLMVGWTLHRIFGKRFSERKDRWTLPVRKCIFLFAHNYHYNRQFKFRVYSLAKRRLC